MLDFRLTLWAFQLDLSHELVELFVEIFNFLFRISGHGSGRQFLDPELGADLTHMSADVLATFICVMPNSA